MTEGRHDWAHGEESRFGIYIVRLVDGKLAPVLQGATSEEGIGVALRTWKQEGEIDDTRRIGILDGFGELGWLVNPFVGRG